MTDEKTKMSDQDVKTDATTSVPPSGDVPAKDTDTKQEPKEETKAGKTFTQEDLDRIVRERLERERQKFADYEDLQKTAAKWKEHEEAQMSEIDLLKKRLEEKDGQLRERQQEIARLELERTEMLVRSAVVAEASKMGFQDPMDAYELLDVAKLEVTEEGGVEGVKEALTELGEAKPYLIAQQEQRGPTSILPTKLPKGGKSAEETDAERRRRMFGVGETPIGKAQGGGMLMPE